MIRSVQFLAVSVGVMLAVALAGCAESGPATARVKGTLTIDGQPASDVTVTFAPVDSSLPAASGPVSDGSFELFSGGEGKPGAAPGKYKVVLAVAGAAAGAGQTPDYMNPEKAAGGGSSAPVEQELPFPKKYTQASTSDKEVEVTSGSNDIKIDITSQ